ncbi:MAG: methyltransferase domain-containing protein [Gemmatimonadetes bacterium]|nr:methyltransferase domain-containing protein [Gemmatimonadota bacterium]
MSDQPAGPGAGDDLLLARSPSILALARLSHRLMFPLGGVELYRHFARLVSLGPQQEFVIVPCGRGASAQFLAELTSAGGAGADPDAELADSAAARAGQAGLGTRLHYQHAPLEDLPYKDDVFDVSVGEIGLSAAADPAAAVRELTRVTKPMGSVVLIQLVWTRHIQPERREGLCQRWGVRPFLLVEWKQMLREAGVVELYVEDWSDGAAVLWPHLGLRWLAELLSLPDRLAMLYAALRRWGWRGLRGVISLEKEVRQTVARERVLGVSLIKGTKWQAQPGSAP